MRVVQGVGLGLFIIAGSARAAWAQACPRDLSREQMVERAQGARRRGDHGEAIRLARCAGALEMRPLLRLFLATEHRALEQSADALREARACVEEAPRDPTFHRIEECRAIVRELEPRVAPPASPPPPPPPPPPPVTTVPAVVVSPTRPLEPPPSARSASLGPWILGGVGLLALGAGGAFAGLRSTAIDDMNDACSEATRSCSPTAVTFRDDANTWTTATNAALIGGAGLLVGGVVWWIIDRRSTARVERLPMVSASLRGDGWVIGVGGSL